MGLLRLILAFSVIFGHTIANDHFFFHPFFFINASAAVVCFFTVSGFYMAYVINEKYKFVGGWRKKFLFNRCLRMYPAYYLFLALYLVFQIYVGTPNFLTGFAGLSASYRALIAFLNFSVVGQDVYAMFLERRNIDPMLAIPIAQAWSIAVELELYAAAALLFASRFGLFASLGIGIVLRLLMQSLGLIVFPIGGMLVFNVFLFFALGGCGYILYKRIENWPVALRGVIAGALVTIFIFYSWRYNGFWKLEARGNDYRLTLLYFGVALATPFIFSLSRKSKLDNFLGNLSYPVYLCHILVFDVVSHLGPYAKIKYLPTALILALSYAAYKYVEEPVQGIRKRVAQPMGKMVKMKK